MADATSPQLFFTTATLAAAFGRDESDIREAIDKCQPVEVEGGAQLFDNAAFAACEARFGNGDALAASHWRKVGTGTVDLTAEASAEVTEDIPVDGPHTLHQLAAAAGLDPHEAFAVIDAASVSPEGFRDGRYVFGPDAVQALRTALQV